MIVGVWGVLGVLPINGLVSFMGGVTFARRTGDGESVEGCLDVVGHGKVESEEELRLRVEMHSVAFDCVETNIYTGYYLKK